ncbi:MAG: hypothetical protein HQL53_05930 [Magnetococcales bacterium]|nr:hypothetical protein [Magnetococcales bacterium]
MPEQKQILNPYGPGRLGKRLGFRELLQLDKDPHAGRFRRYMPDGNLAVEKVEPVEVKPPEPPPEEIHQRKLEQIERETYQKAFEAGEKAGFEAGLTEMQEKVGEFLPRLASVLHELDGVPARYFATSEQLMVESAILLTKRLVGHELSVHPEGVAHRVRRIMEHAIGRDEMVVHLPPEEAEAVQSIDGFEHLSIVADASMSPGSVRLETDFGAVEEDMEARLRDVETALRSVLSGRLDAMEAEGVEVKKRSPEDLETMAAWSEEQEKNPDEPPAELAAEHTPVEQQATEITPEADEEHVDGIEEEEQFGVDEGSVEAADGGVDGVGEQLPPERMATDGLEGANSEDIDAAIMMSDDIPEAVEEPLEAGEDDGFPPEMEEEEEPAEVMMSDEIPEAVEEPLEEAPEALMSDEIPEAVEAPEVVGGVEVHASDERARHLSPEPKEGNARVLDDDAEFTPGLVVPDASSSDDGGAV